MSRTKFIMIGGFLGAGKTTAIARLAKHYTAQGQKVGLITNDQANGLVDTQALRAQGFHVGEVPGACFCCKFDDLLSTIDGLKKEHHPDIVITEPVGSCTDLVATVIEPLRRFHDGNYQIAPLTVLLKPEHGAKILSGDGASGFSPQAAYIFLKQMEEADLIAINKIDKLSEDQKQQLKRQVEQRFPDKTVTMVSGKDGTGFDRLTQTLEESSPLRKRMMDVDYQRYAEGEAELGWLNASYELTAKNQDSFSIDRVVVELMQTIRDNLLATGAEPAHLKILCQSNDKFAVSNLVGSDVDVELSIASHASVPTATLFVNARAVVTPNQLEASISDSVATLAEVTPTRISLQSFSPAAPVPTHRVQ
ncbi:MAG: GTP-binding protein [Pirellulaceae bacterium]|nr:GTP-binding protein [Pirellulaceae bacterium]